MYLMASVTGCSNKAFKNVHIWFSGSQFPSYVLMFGSLNFLDMFAFMMSMVKGGTGLSGSLFGSSSIRVALGTSVLGRGESKLITA